MRQKRKQILTIAALAAGLLAALLPVGPAAAASVATAVVSNPLTGIAIDGYDPVSYFTETEPLPGNSAYEYHWGGAPWYFASEANRDVFKRAPAVYAPQFGGHGTMALARGYLSDGNPRIYLVLGQRLYLFYSSGNREAFLLVPEKSLADARANWSKLARELVAR